MKQCILLLFVLKTWSVFLAEIVEKQNTNVSSFVEKPCMASLQSSTAPVQSCMASLQSSMASLQSSTAALKLTELGEVAKLEWYKSIELRPDMNILLDEFIVMPNHIHGIICIGKNEFNSDVSRDAIQSRDAMHGVSSNEILGTTTSLHGISTEKDYKNQFGPQSKNISSIIRGYKSAVTTFARKQNLYFEWQPRFHDHIIRSATEYYKISNYIISNPSTWINDKFNPKNILLK